MLRILIIFAHPAFEKSRTQKELLAAARSLDGITINDLYESYPEFDIDIRKEQELLLAHDIIIWQHPLYWYSCPAILKQWIDLVLEHGWAYGKNGTALSGKVIFNAISSGGGKASYHAEGFHARSIHDFLLPFRRTAELCNMEYWPPFWVAGTNRMQQQDIGTYGADYAKLLSHLRTRRFGADELTHSPTLNDLISQYHPIPS